MGLVKSAEEILAEIGAEEDEGRPSLTELQRELVDAIAAFAREFGYWPLCEELTERLGIPERIVAQRVRMLRQKGYVEAGTRGLSQSIRLAVGVRDVGTVGPRPGPPALPCRSLTHSRNAYANGHCRCPIGRAAHAEHCRRQRANRRARVEERVA
jgi:hypothetical protein